MTARSLSLLGLSLAAVSATLGARVLSEYISRPDGIVPPHIASDATAQINVPVSPAPPVTLSPADPVLLLGETTSSMISFVGTEEQTRYGSVQVAVVFEGDTIAGIDLLQGPTEDAKSAELTQQAAPLLATRVIEAQGTNIDGVSGATYTSDAYLSSVQSAIDQYRAGLD